MNWARENAAWAGCGGPTRHREKWHADGFTLISDRQAYLHVHPVRKGAYRAQGLMWFPTESAATQWRHKMYPSLYPSALATP